MEYTFSTRIVDTTNDIIYLVSSDIYVLERFSSDDWTVAIVQEIIDGVTDSQTAENFYEWANEDVHIVSIKNEGVFFFDVLAHRGGQRSENQDFELSHDEFFTFLEDFKGFVQEN